jgi:hypothetical protein
MNAIFKYPIMADGSLVIALPKGAKILDVQAQHGNPFIWALVDDEAPKEKRVFEIYGTGHPIKNITEPTAREYIGTFQLNGGSLVFHLFELVLPF